MIEVDISNVWGELALPDLLAMEKEVFDAHIKLTEGEALPEWFCQSAETLRRMQTAAQRIRCNSQVCVVVGIGTGFRGARAAVELLQGVHRNLCTEGTQIFFAGDSLSTRRWKELETLLDGRDFSVIVISGPDMPAESGIALRSLRWMLERKYGTDEANSRIYAVADPEQGALGQMAREAGWETFAGKDFGVLTAAGLLPMAAAGIDIEEVLKGAMAGRDAYDLRSYENPVWLYAAVRSLMYRGGKTMELLACFAAGFRSFGGWWQQLFARSGEGAFSVAAEYPADCHFPGQQKNMFETLVRFAPGEEEHLIGSDWKNLDGLNHLEGKSLSFVEEQAYGDTVAAHADAGIPVLTVDCGRLNEGTMGELLYFLELSCGICAGMEIG